MSDQVNNQQGTQEEPSLSELLQIRRDKLAELQRRGQDPFQPNCPPTMSRNRPH